MFWFIVRCIEVPSNCVQRDGGGLAGLGTPSQGANRDVGEIVRAAASGNRRHRNPLPGKTGRQLSNDAPEVAGAAYFENEAPQRAKLPSDEILVRRKLIGALHLTRQSEGDAIC